MKFIILLFTISLACNTDFDSVDIIVYHSNLKVKISGQMANEKPVGRWMYWWNDGELKKIEWYKDGKLHKFMDMKQWGDGSYYEDSDSLDIKREFEVNSQD